MFLILVCVPHLDVLHWDLEILLEVVYHEWKILLWSCTLFVEDLPLVLCIGIWRSSLAYALGFVICVYLEVCGLISWLLVFISCVMISLGLLEIS